jgi:hypothetical protein
MSYADQPLRDFSTSAYEGDVEPSASGFEATGVPGKRWHSTGACKGAAGCVVATVLVLVVVYHVRHGQPDAGAEPRRVLAPNTTVTVTSRDANNSGAWGQGGRPAAGPLAAPL